MASSSSAAANANAANVVDPIHTRAFEKLRMLKSQYWHPSLSIASVIRATPTCLQVKFPANEFVLSDRISQTRIGKTCQLVAMASFAVGEESSLNFDDVHHDSVFFKLFTLPEPHEEIVITANVRKVAGSLPQTRYDASVLRNNQMVVAIAGSSEISVVPSNLVQHDRNVPIHPPLPSVQGTPLRGLTDPNQKDLIAFAPIPKSE